MKRLGKYISIIYRHNNIYYGKEMLKIGITNGQYMFILYVFENEGISQDEIAENLHMDKSTVARGIAQLINEKFLVKIPNENDRRIFNIFTTEKGRKIYPKIIKILDERNNFLMKNFTNEEKKLIINILEKISDNVLEYYKKGDDN